VFIAQVHNCKAAFRFILTLHSRLDQKLGKCNVCSENFIFKFCHYFSEVKWLLSLVRDLFLVDSCPVDLANALTGNNVRLCSELWHARQYSKQKLFRLSEVLLLKTFKYSWIEVPHKSALEHIFLCVKY